MQYAESVLNFSRNCDYAMYVVDHLLDILTGNEHRKTSKYIEEMKNLRKGNYFKDFLTWMQLHTYIVHIKAVLYLVFVIRQILCSFLAQKIHNFAIFVPQSFPRVFECFLLRKKLRSGKFLLKFRGVISHRCTGAHAPAEILVHPSSERPFSLVHPSSEHCAPVLWKP